MASLYRTLVAETEDDANTTIYLNSNCSSSTGFSFCYTSDGHCICTNSLSPPPPPPAHTPPHLVSYLISAVCALGVAFLILSTCTILLRQRWARRSRSRETNSGARMAVLLEADRNRQIDHPIWHINTVGLPQSVIDEITSFKYTKLEQGGMLTEQGRTADCSVCLAEFEDGDDLRLLPKCSHAFHLECIDTWLLSHTNCPLCRAPVVSDSLNSETMMSFGLIESEQPRLSGLSPVDSSNVSVIDGDGTGDGGESSEGIGKGEYLAELRMEVGRIGKSNREHTRVLSDLGSNSRMMDVGGGDAQQQQTGTGRRSASLDVTYVSAMSSSSGPFMVEVVSSSLIEEPSSSSSSSKQEKDSDGDDDGVEKTKEPSSSSSKQQKDSHGDDDEVEKTTTGSTSRRWLRGTTMSNLMMKSSSIGRSFRKAAPQPQPQPGVSMNRSLSTSSGKMFPFLGSKRHASVLPL